MKLTITGCHVKSSSIDFQIRVTFREEKKESIQSKTTNQSNFTNPLTSLIKKNATRFLVINRISKMETWWIVILHENLGHLTSLLN